MEGAFQVAKNLSDFFPCKQWLDMQSTNIMNTIRCLEKDFHVEGSNANICNFFSYIKIVRGVQKNSKDLTKQKSQSPFQERCHI